jgi:RNA polymerase subunit RPABC4/transcription elongation factor Spt4
MVTILGAGGATLTIAEHDAEKTACPHCGSHEVEQSWSAFSAITSKKSA